MSGLPYILKHLNAYVHSQETPVATVIIHHNKLKLHPNVILTESDGTEFDAQIKSVDLNTIEICLNCSIPFTVYIY